MISLSQNQPFKVINSCSISFCLEIPLWCRTRLEMWNSHRVQLITGTDILPTRQFTNTDQFQRQFTDKIEDSSPALLDSSPKKIDTSLDKSYPPPSKWVGLGIPLAACSEYGDLHTVNKYQMHVHLCNYMLDWHSCQICYPLEIKLSLLLLL